MSSSDWLSEARTIKKLALKNKSAELYVQPIFKGKQVMLEYVDLKLRISDLDKKLIQLLRKSGVPRYLTTDTYANWGGVSPKRLYVHGVLVRSRKKESTKRFVATQVCGDGGKAFHNQITSMHLLFARGFYTPLAQSSWMHTRDIKPDTLQQRLKAKEKLRVENIHGKAFSATAPIGLRLFDCIGWKARGRNEIHYSETKIRKQ